MNQHNKKMINEAERILHQYEKKQKQNIKYIINKKDVIIIKICIAIIIILTLITLYKMY